MQNANVAEQIAVSLLVAILVLAMRAGIFVWCFNHLASIYGLPSITFANAILVVVGVASLIPSRASNG